MITNVKIVDPKMQSRIGSTQINLMPGINLFVGSNGCGKSSLIESIMHEVESGDSKVARLIRDPSVQVLRYSAEQATVKFGSNPDNDAFTGRNQSHGQGLRQYLEALRNIEGETVCILDEPETALDFFAVNDLCALMASKPNVQWIVSTHHPLIMTMKNANIINLDRNNKDYAKDVLKQTVKRLKVAGVI